MYTVNLPFILTIRNANCIIERCQLAISSTEDEVLFDFSTCAFIDPFATTLLVGAIRATQASGHKVKYLHPENKNLEAYFKSVGFYEWGAGRGAKEGHTIHQVELRHLTGFDPAYTDAVIVVLKGILKMSQGVKDSLHLSINELLQNTFDHSRAVGGCFVCAQAYTERGNVSICIADLGIGILKSLTSVPNYQHLTNSIDAIKKAVEEGVTSRGKAAGLGLTVIHQFLKSNEGEIHILSGDGWVHWNYRSGNGVIIKEKKLKVAFGGTIVNIIARADADGLYIMQSENLEDQIF